MKNLIKIAITFANIIRIISISLVLLALTICFFQLLLFKKELISTYTSINTDMKL